MTPTGRRLADLAEPVRLLPLGDRLPNVCHERRRARSARARSAEWTAAPSLSYIVPNRCHDGSDTPCAPGQPSGLPAADAFLQAVVPQIMASPAYSDGGLITITFDEAPETGPNADQSACCFRPAYPNLPPESSSPLGGPVSPTGGGGRVGLLLLSQYVLPATTSQTTTTTFPSWPASRISSPSRASATRRIQRSRCSIHPSTTGSRGSEQGLGWRFPATLTGSRRSQRRRPGL